ncbi:MAG: Tm-1-like ATP-binding domain-containing protein [Rhizobiaceae bacterium]|nr:Tm-1-like ATP-binding domain-containing protein [Rhizobiaceae bacterium]
MKRIYVVGTADTKGGELEFLVDCISKAGGKPVLVDVGTTEPSLAPDVNRHEVARHGTQHAQADLASGDRGRAVGAMAEAFAAFLASRNDVAGVIGIGGGGGTSIATAGMRRLPLGVPKVMVSTLASGDVSPYVDISDIIMMPSITDLAGLNRISRMVLANAASAISAMAQHYSPASDAGRSIGLTMFGVTTACVTQIVERLKASLECLVFHATGTGGRTMEKLVDSGLIGGVIDITTTEICDLLFGGVLPATEDRLGAVARTGIPYVGSVGALDMVNFWAPDTVPDRYRGRLFYNHNSNVTLMRTTREESIAIGEWIGRKLNSCEGFVRFLIPEKGVSALDIEGGAFWDPGADEALFNAIEATVTQTPRRKVVRLPLHINDPAFAEAAAAAFTEIEDR